MVACTLLKSEHIADIIFGGNRSHASKNIVETPPVERGALSRLVTKLFDCLRPEAEEHSLASAHEYLHAIGYKDWQVNRFEKILKNCLRDYVEDAREGAANGEYHREIPTLEHNKRYYLGAHVGESGLDLNRRYKTGSEENALTLREHFIHELKTARHEVRGLLYTHFELYRQTISIESPFTLDGTR